MVLKHSDKIVLYVGEPAGIRKLPNNKDIHDYSRLDYGQKMHAYAHVAK